MALLPSASSTATLPMVSVVPPSVTSVNPSLNVVTPTITYNQLINSLGTYNYGAIFFIYRVQLYNKLTNHFSTLTLMQMVTKYQHIYPSQSTHTNFYHHYITIT